MAKRLITIISVLFFVSMSPQLLFASAAPPPNPYTTDADGWISLFDGKTLSGWTAKYSCCLDKIKTVWTVENGTIVCNSNNQLHDYVYLVNEKEYDDFELKLKVFAFPDSTGNSGVQVRSRWDNNDNWLNGPQVDIHPPGPWRNGCIYDETAGVKDWIFPKITVGDLLDPVTDFFDFVITEEDLKAELNVDELTYEWHQNDWNEIYIKCVGTNIYTEVNGIAVADYDGAGFLDDYEHEKFDVGMNGNIALQLHMWMIDTLHVAFKDIYVRPIE